MDLKYLVLKAQQGDEQCYEELCRRFDPLAKKYANQQHLRLVHEDALSEARLAVVEAITSYDAAGGVPFSGYVKARVTYAVWNFFKRERKRWQAENDVSVLSEDGVCITDIPDPVNIAEQIVDELVMSLELRPALMQAIGTLSDKQRLVLLQTVVGQTSLRSLARELGISVQAVYNTKQRAIKRLKEALQGTVR